jgi:arginine decarboxylase
MLASTLGLEFDEDKSWDENKAIYQLHDKIVRTSNTTQSTVIGPEGNYSTVMAAAVFLL